MHIIFNSSYPNVAMHFLVSSRNISFNFFYSFKNQKHMSLNFLVTALNEWKLMGRLIISKYKFFFLIYYWLLHENLLSKERWYQRKEVCKDSFFVILGSPIFRDMPQAFVRIIDRILEKNFTTPTAQIMPPLFHYN